MKRVFPIFLIVILLFAACEKGTRYYRTSKDKFPPKPPDFDVLVTEGDLDRHYIEIGVIQVVRKADNPFDEIQPEQLIPLFKEQGRLIGADAVIKVYYDLPEDAVERIKKLTGRGIAIKILSY